MDIGAPIRAERKAKDFVPKRKLDWTPSPWGRNRSAGRNNSLRIVTRDHAPTFHRQRRRFGPFPACRIILVGSNLGIGVNPFGRLRCRFGDARLLKPGIVNPHGPPPPHFNRQRLRFGIVARGNDRGGFENLGIAFSPFNTRYPQTDK